MTKIDLVMWTKNGAGTLPAVLKRINEVIPAAFVNERVIVDDKSVDNTTEIAQSFGWDVVSNEGNGISDGANTALKHVTSEYFISLEQDLLLSETWWERIPSLFNEEKVVVASGVRLPDKPTSVRKIQEYTTERYSRETSHRAGFFYGKTLDNTMYKTEFMRDMGGFPKLKANAGVDTVLAKRVSEKQTWRVDFSVKSIHLRRSLWHEIKQYYWYGTCEKELKRELGDAIDGIAGAFLRACFSPIRGFQIAYRKRYWKIVFVYPLIRLSGFLGVLRSYL